MESPLIFGYILDGSGGAKELDWNQSQRLNTVQELVWLHLDYKTKETHRWLKQDSGLAPEVAQALLAEDTRPRCFSYKSGLLVILRGVNLNPNSDPDDMVSLRVWIEPQRIFSIRHRKVMAVDEISQKLQKGEGPSDAGDFLVQLTRGLALRVSDIISQIDDDVDAIEDEIIEKESFEQRSRLSVLRRQVIRIRRYLAPQREVMNHLQLEKTSLISESNRIQLREIADQIIRNLEDLDSAKDRAAICQEELENRISSQMNKTLYVLSIITAIFLPLGLITGLLGINVGGIPGSENPFAFIFVCLFLAAIVAAQVMIFRKIRWL